MGALKGNNIFCGYRYRVREKRGVKKSAGIYLINRENVDWFSGKSGFPFDFDTAVIDELSSFKSYSTKRSKSLLKIRPKIKRIAGLTGTPSSNALWICRQRLGSLIWDRGLVSTSQTVEDSEENYFLG